MGVHKSVTTECASCHADHGGVDGEMRPFDQRAFDHTAVTGFPMTGKHAPLALQCAACHKERSFLTLTTSTCASCHQDVHMGKFGTTCESCHSTTVAFKDFSGQFDHSKAAFQLVGAHRTVTCASCHVNNVFKGVKFASCTDCHRDPHRPVFSATCTSCHTNDTWRTQKVDHTRTSFPLVGLHTSATCISCHKQPAMKVKPKADTCASCHMDVHRGTFKQDCNACHTESGFAKAPFDHSKTMFTLTGKHTGLACEACHKSVVRAPRSAADRVADYRGLKTTCVSCHADVHQAALGTACESCHTSTSFKVTTFTHPRFPEFFTGQHAQVECAKCHVPEAPTRPTRTGVTVLNVTFKSLPTTCVSCHKDVHLGQVSVDCQSCHSVQTAKFALQGFSHTKTSFPLTGRHEAITCVECHKRETGAFPAGAGTAVKLKGVAKECRACHADVHLGQLNVACEGCHQTSSFKLPSYVHRNRTISGFLVGSHARATCDACHKVSTGRFPQGAGTAVNFKVETRCVACHTDVHHGALGPRCGDCHKP